jgi:hypothetical protein
LREREREEERRINKVKFRDFQMKIKKEEKCTVEELRGLPREESLSAKLTRVCRD